MSGAVARTVTCGFCGVAFEEDRGQPTCGRCPLGEGCHYIRCPACGYENPVAPAWVERLKAWTSRGAGRSVS